MDVKLDIKTHYKFGKLGSHYDVDIKYCPECKTLFGCDDYVVRDEEMVRFQNRTLYFCPCCGKKIDNRYSVLYIRDGTLLGYNENIIKKITKKNINEKEYERARDALVKPLK